MAKNTKGKDDGVNVDFGSVLGGGLGGLFKGIENLVDMAAKLKDAGGQVDQEGEIDLGHLKEGMKGVFGFSVKTAVGGGKTVVEPFGNVKTSSHGATVEEEREPITDVFDEDQEIRVYAEMPGVNQNDIILDLTEDILDISAHTGDRQYHKEVLLPAKVQVDTMTSSYSNGILEIKVKK